MTCILSQCACEGRSRAEWPMPESPLAFFGPETWLDDSSIDRTIIAGRLCANEFTAEEAGELLGIQGDAVKQLTVRGRMYPTRYDPRRGNPRPIYGAERLAGELIRRGRSVSA